MTGPWFIVNSARGNVGRAMTYGVGAVVLSSSLAATGGTGLGLVHGVGRCVRVRGLLCNLVGDVWTESQRGSGNVWGEETNCQWCSLPCRGEA